MPTPEPTSTPATTGAPRTPAFRMISGARASTRTGRRRRSRRARRPTRPAWSSGATAPRNRAGSTCRRGRRSTRPTWTTGSFRWARKSGSSSSSAGRRSRRGFIWKTDAYDWVPLDYRWSPDGTSTQRLDTGEKNVNGTTYEIPATNVCSQCHNGSPDTVLGIDFVGLATSGAQGVTVSTLEAQNAFTQNPPSTTLAIPEDSTGKAAAALGWLHVNCGIGCHNANSGAGASQTQLYLKLVAGEILMADGGVGPVSGLDTYTTAVGKPAIQLPNGMPAERIDPGHADESLVSILAGTRCVDAGVGCIQMPPIVSHIPDDAGLALVNAWINALPPLGDP